MIYNPNYVDLKYLRIWFNSNIMLRIHQESILPFLMEGKWRKGKRYAFRNDR